MDRRCEESNYWRDPRVRVTDGPALEVDERRMVGRFTVEGDDGEEVAHELRVEFRVCGLCDGHGTVVDPAVDCCGLSADEFCDDERASYLGGGCDVGCPRCGGRRVVPEPVDDGGPAHMAWLGLLEDWREYDACVRAERAMGA